MASSTNYDVIVVGGGISGLVAAHHLTKSGRKVLILEARDRVGGRINTVAMNGREDHKVDLGASYVHGTHGNPLVTMARMLDMDLHFINITPGVVRDHFGCVPDKIVESKLVSNAVNGLFVHMRQSAQSHGSNKTAPADVSLIGPYTAPDSPLYTGLESELSRTQAVYLARSYSGWCGADMDKVSFKWWGFEQDTQGPDAIVISGYVTLVNWLRDEILKGGSVIQLSEEVVGIEHIKEQQDTVTVTTSSTKKVSSTSRSTTSYKARCTLITLPLGVLQKRPPTFNPPLPPRRIEATNRLGSGLLNKVVVYYEEAWWARNETFFFLPDPSNPTNLLGRAEAPAGMFIHNLWSLQRTPAICFFVGGSAAMEIESMTDKEVAEWGAGTVEQYLSPDKPAPPATQVVATRWMSDPFAQGSYSYIPTSAKGKIEATPLDMIEMSHALWGNRLFFAGEHTEPDEYASVHAAWNSGLREGRKIEVVLDAEDGIVE